jgi:hypothetical protein
MNFYEMLNLLENFQSSLNLTTNRQDTLTAFELMEGDYILRQKGDYTIDGAIEWLNSMPEDGYYVVYGNGGYNRYFVYPNGDVKFSAYHAEHPKKETTKKAQDLGFQIH